MIEREVIEFVGAVDWTDDCRVKVELRKRRMTLTVTEAEQLRAELDTAIQEASVAAEGLLHVPVPLGSDVDPMKATVYCRSTSGPGGSGNLCTRPDGHEGVHVAQTDPFAVPYAAWGEHR